MARNPHIELLETAHGGHCAFLAVPDKRTADDGYWAEHTALRFILKNS
jgi:predicted alpha/beta-fold hydrolase